MKVRLAEIDKPERHQPYGTRARQDLAELTFQRQVRVKVQDVGCYGRMAGRIYAGPVDSNIVVAERGAGCGHCRRGSR